MATDTPALSLRLLRCVVVTPERAAIDETADFVALPMYDGELGVAPGRLPLIGRLGYGELRIVRGAAVRRYYVDGGFVQVRADVVTVLTARAVAAGELKTEAAVAILDAARGLGGSPEVQKARQRDQDRARAQLRLAAKVRAEEAAAVPVVGR